MEQFNVSVLISNSNGTEESFEEFHQGSLKSLVNTLKNVKDVTNEYLTRLVDQEKRNKSHGAHHVEKTSEEDSDVEIKEDHIDSKIKKELLSGQSNVSEKRTRSCSRSRKKVKY